MQTKTVVRGAGGAEFANWKGRIEKVIKFFCEKKTLAAVRGAGGLKFSNKEDLL